MTVVVRTPSCVVDDAFEPGAADANTATVAFEHAGVDTTVESASVAVDWVVTQVHNPVTIVDDFEGDITVLGEIAVDGDGNLVVDAESGAVVDGRTVTYSYDAELTVDPGECASFTNVVRVVDEDEALDEDDATVEMCSEDDLAVVKTAAGSIDRTYLWEIEKTVVDNYGDVRPGTVVRFPYTVTVTPKGYEDANQTLSGSITVTNPNGYKAVSATVVDDVDDEAWTCTVAGTPASVAAASTVTLTYTCTLDDDADAPALEGTNTVEITWETLDGTTKTTSHEVEYTLVLNETNKEITVVDQFAGEGPRTLGTAVWNAEGTPKVWEYPMTWTAPSKGGRYEVRNTATITQTGQTSTVRVDFTVRPPVGPPKTGS